MDYNLAQLLKQAVGAVREFALDESLKGMDPALDATEHLTGKLRLIRTKDGALMMLTGKTSLQFACSRCLEPVIVPVSLDIEEQLLQTVDVVTGVPVGAPHDDPAVLIDKHHDVHLGDVIREYLLLELPMRPLCRDDCKGLCPTCGHNLNQGPCRCDSAPIDERWASLADMLKSKQQ